MEISWDHIHIRCQDMDEAEKFYTQTMGAKVLARSEVLGMPITRLELGGQCISISPKREEMTEMEPLGDLPRWGVWQIGFKVSDMKEAYELYKSKGAKFKAEPNSPRPGVWTAFIQGPDGVEIELLQVP